MKVVIDTNIILVSVSQHSPFHWVFKSLFEGKFAICVTNDILYEYEEIIEQEMGSKVASNVMQTLENLPNVEFITKYYYWELIKADYDDNKFVDCYVASNANYIVTNDKHFNVLKNINFPRILVVNIDEFKSIILANK